MRLALLNCRGSPRGLPGLFTIGLQFDNIWRIKSEENTGRMVNTLRNRLLLSYVAILLIMLVLIGFVLVAFLATRPVPTDEIIRDLTATLLDVRVVDVLQFEFRGQGQGGTGPRPRLELYEQFIINYLAEESASRDVRTLVVTPDGHVQFDSFGNFQPGMIIHETERVPLLSPGRLPLRSIYRGRFIDADGSAWLYVAQPLRPFNAEAGPDPAFMMVADPVPKASLRQVFKAFGNTFFVPLLRAGLIGLVVAVGLAVVVSGSVARPLKRMSEAARRIANGDFRQRVPARGPREVRTLAQSFNEMVERVATTQQVQRDFLANVSHDLRTPLTSIQGFSQAIAEGVASDPEAARRAAQIIHDEATRLHRMVESLLDLARIEAGRLDMQAHAVALSDLLNSIGQSLSVKARDRGVDLRLKVPPDLPRIAGDGDRLAQVFTNLVDNAIKHTPSGGTIVLRAQLAGDGVAIIVQDTGAGIPPEDLPRIFERFYQVDKSRQHDPRSGMGLGLAITRQIVEAHGGAIQVASRVGVGTTFTVWLPLPGSTATTVVTRR